MDPVPIPPADASLKRREFLLAVTAVLGSTLLPAPAAALAAAGSAKAPPVLDDLLNMDDFEAAARNMLPHSHYEFFASGAADELTLRWNRERYGQLRLRPRVLMPSGGLDASIELFGQRLDSPILIAPTSNHKLAHPDGELATVRGAGLAKTIMVLSNSANVDVREVVTAATQPVWFQLYVQPDRGLTRDIVRHAEAAGTQALCVTVDSPVDGVRNRQNRARVRMPAGVTHPNYLARNLEKRSVQTLEEVRPTKLDWDDIAWLLSFARTPVLLKGIMTPEDADRAVRTGVAGIIVSNHGGRALDTVPATIEALPAIAEKVAGRVPVLVDGGIRRGSDVLKALALGATATLVGRPILYALASGGAEGVARALRILRMELLISMALSGRPAIAQIDRSVLWD